MFSTVLLQLEVPDRFRGRVFAAELALVTLDIVGVELLDRVRARSRRMVAANDGVRARGYCSACPGHSGLIIVSRWKESDVAAAPRGVRHVAEDGGPRGSHPLITP